MQASLILVGCVDKVKNTGVTSLKDFQMSNAVFCPLPANDDTVSQPVKAWNMGSERAFSSPSAVAMAWVGTYLRCLPVPNATHSSVFSSVTCTALVSSWCLRLLVSMFPEQRFRELIWNSLMTLASSGPATIQRNRALGFCNKPTAPPSPFTILLFCSCAWSIAIAEKGRFVHNKASLSELACYIRVSFMRCHHVTNMNWHPSRIVCVVQCKQPWCQRY